MGVLGMIQIILNVFLLLGVFILWVKLSKRPKDDPRLSRGLQLLQSKISVLEDLSDRTDVQVKQLMELLDGKAKQLQSKIFESEKQVQRIEQSMHKSLEVADIFQDKIPHEEIIERQTSVKYIQAAQLAHQGKSVDEVVKLVGLPKGEVEFIVKVNKDQLMFDNEKLPAWAQKKAQNIKATSDDAYSVERVIGNIEGVFEPSGVDLGSLEKLGKDFRKACSDHDFEEKKYEDSRIDLSPAIDRAKVWTKKTVGQAGGIINDTAHRVAGQASALQEVAQVMGQKVKGGIQKNFDLDGLPKESIDVETSVPSDPYPVAFEMNGPNESAEFIESTQAEKKEFTLSNDINTDMSIQGILDQAHKTALKVSENNKTEVAEKIKENVKPTEAPVKKVIFPRIDEGPLF